MSDSVPAATDPSEAVITALIEIIKTGTDPEILAAQRLLVQRAALEGSLVPSRLPPPANITQIGGYLNLLTALNDTETRARMIASVLGVRGPAPVGGSLASLPAIGFLKFDNHRPEGAFQAAIPVQYSVRADFTDPLVLALGQLAAQGCSLPLLTPTRALPRLVPGVAAPLDALPHIGRDLRAVPATLVGNPDDLPLAWGRLDSEPATAFRLLARELDGLGTVAAANWVTVEAVPSSFTERAAASLPMVSVDEVLAAAGWAPATRVVTSDADPRSGAGRYVNLTGLVVDETRLGDELTLLYSGAEITASVFAPRLDWIWNGAEFAAP